MLQGAPEGTSGESAVVTIAEVRIRLTVPGGVQVECETVEEAAELCRRLVGGVEQGEGHSRRRLEMSRMLFPQLHAEIRRASQDGVLGTRGVANGDRAAVVKSGDAGVCEDPIENIVNAVPSFPEAFLNTMEIWHRAGNPKPSYTETAAFLRKWANAGTGLVRRGSKRGPQWYRYDDRSW